MPIPSSPSSRASSPPPPPAAPLRPPAAGRPPRETFDPIAGALAYLFPGAGHFYLGHRARAACICVGVLSLFIGGLFIGGIDVIDRRDNTIWFVGQALAGPIAFGVDALHQARKVMGPTKQLDGTTRLMLRDPYPDEGLGADGRAVPLPPGATPAMTRSLGRMNELGTLFTTIAGMLNLIVIIDAAFQARVSTLRALGLQSTLADANRGIGAPQTIDASLKPGGR